MQHVFILSCIFFNNVVGVITEKRKVHANNTTNNVVKIIKRFRYRSYR